MRFNTRMLPAKPDEVAPDGSDVRMLLSLEGGSMAHFELVSGRISRAVIHRTVDEVWYILSGRGAMWRKRHKQEEVVTLKPGICLTIPRGTKFQFRSHHDESLTAIGVTIPPWPGDAEAGLISGKWEPTD